MPFRMPYSGQNSDNTCKRHFIPEVFLRKLTFFSTICSSGAFNSPCKRHLSNNLLNHLILTLHKKIPSISTVYPKIFISFNSRSQKYSPRINQSIRKHRPDRANILPRQIYKYEKIIHNFLRGESPLLPRSARRDSIRKNFHPVTGRSCTNNHIPV